MITTLIRTSFPALFKSLFLQPWFLSCILSLRKLRASVLDLLQMVGSPRYWPQFETCWTRSTSVTSRFRLSSAAALNYNINFAKLNLYPEALKYSFRIPLRFLAFSIDPFIKKKESSTKNKWWITGHACFSLTLSTIRRSTCFSIVLESTATTIMNR